MAPQKGVKPKAKVKTCIDCGEKYLAYIAQKRCPKCQESKLESEQKPKRTLICPFCKEKFVTRKTNKKYCSDECKKAYHSKEYYRRKNEDKNSNNQ